MKPAELIHTPAGEEVFDLGQEITGIFRLRVHEPAGTTIRIQTGEVLQDGCFYNENLRTALSEYIYVSDGTEKVITPHFTYYGYRYVKVTGVRDLSCEDFTALVLYSDYESIGAIETGNDLVNKLISNIEWGMKGNFLDVPTDCPQRDERMGWTGDTQVFSATASYLADTYAFYRKYLYDLYKEQLIAGGMVPEVVPTFGPSKCSCAWGDAACIVPWNVYLFSGDAAILEQQFDSMKAWVDYIRKVDGEHHGWSIPSITETGWRLTGWEPRREMYTERPMKAILRIFIMRQARSLQRRQRRFSAKGRGKTISGNRRKTMACGKRRIFYPDRKMRGKDTDGSSAGSEISFVRGRRADQRDVKETFPREQKQIEYRICGNLSFVQCVDR